MAQAQTPEQVLAQMNSNDIFTTFCDHCARLDLFDMLNDPLLIFDATTEQLLFMNQRTRNLYEIVESAVLTGSYADFASDKDLLRRAKLSGGKGLISSGVHRRADGELFKVQVSAKFLKLHGVGTVVLLVRDFTTDLQAKDDLAAAGKTQQALLPPDICNSLVRTKSVYRPVSYVSGDVYDYRWHDNLLYAYIADIMGHGLATALQAAAVRMQFGRELETDSPPDEKLRRLNKAVAEGLTSDSFAAAILVCFDFNRRVMTYSSAGINHLIVGRGGDYRLVTTPGPCLGLNQNAEFETLGLALAPGDSVILLSDGLLELLPEKLALPAALEELQAFLAELAGSENQRDDATAVCFSIL